MKLDKQQKALLKCKFKQTHNISNKEIVDEDIDKFLDKDFHGYELLAITILLNKLLY